MKSLVQMSGRINNLRVAAWVAASLAVVLVGCGDSKKKDKPTASQAAARVNKEEITIHQINFVLQQQRGLKAEQAEAASQPAGAPASVISAAMASHNCRSTRSPNACKPTKRPCDRLGRS